MEVTNIIIICPAQKSNVQFSQSPFPIIVAKNI